jgi:hypothetical protein
VGKKGVRDVRFDFVFVTHFAHGLDEAFENCFPLWFFTLQEMVVGFFFGAAAGPQADPLALIARPDPFEPIVFRVSILYDIVGYPIIY